MHRVRQGHHRPHNRGHVRHADPVRDQRPGPQRTLTVARRLHVKIYDTAKNQFQIPESLIERAGPTADASADASDLVFNYNAQPFEFWVTRKGDADDVAPLFDTRKGSLPATPVPPVHADDASTALPEFNLIFEDQYLEVRRRLLLAYSRD